jgi:hypothetical protein
MITIFTSGMRSPRRGLPKAPMAAATTAATMEVATTAVMMVETTAMMTPSDYIRCVVKLVVTPSRISSL